MEQKVDKEAILNKWLDQWFENRPLHFDSIGKILEAMEEYSSSLLKENEELKEKVYAYERADTLFESQLGAKAIERKEKEIERLKGLIEKFWWGELVGRYYPYQHPEANKNLWQQFKERNNL